jgi:hypothetical protein
MCWPLPGAPHQCATDRIPEIMAYVGVEQRIKATHFGQTLSESPNHIQFPQSAIIGSHNYGNVTMYLDRLIATLLALCSAAFAGVAQPSMSASESDVASANPQVIQSSQYRVPIKPLIKLSWSRAETQKSKPTERSLTP